jgi:hypothetical protein
VGEKIGLLQKKMKHTENREYLMAGLFSVHPKRNVQVFVSNLMPRAL